MSRMIEKTNEPAHCRCSRCGHCPCTTCDDLLTCRALPDANRLALHSVLKNSDEHTRQQTRICGEHVCYSEGLACLAAEGASIPCVLRNFHLENAVSRQGMRKTRYKRTFLTCLRREAP